MGSWISEHHYENLYNASKIREFNVPQIRDDFVSKREILYLVYVKFKILGGKVSQNCDEFSLLE